MDSFVHFFVPLLAAHIAVDFLIQTRSEVARKAEPAVLLRHAGLHGVLAYVLVGAWAAWFVPFVVFATHGLIDWIKSKFDPTAPIPFAVDQAAHVVVIVGLALLVDRFGFASSWAVWMGPLYYASLLFLAGGVLVTRTGSIIIEMGLRPFLDEMGRAARSSGIRDAERVGALERGFAQGGRFIGYLERALIFLFVVVGYPAGVGFLVAAKSIFRFGELKDSRNRMEAEYIIIGTLMSFGYGLLVSYLIVFLMRAV